MGITQMNLLQKSQSHEKFKVYRYQIILIVQADNLNNQIYPNAHTHQLCLNFPYYKS